MITTKTATHDWHLIDASGRIMGEIASEIAHLLMGKQKLDYTPHIDAGDHVVVINAEQIVLTGKKAQQKKYRFHSGQPGGMREPVYEELMVKRPDYPIRHAVKGMIPGNKLQDVRLARLHVYVGSEHPHQTHFSKGKQE